MSIFNLNRLKKLFGSPLNIVLFRVNQEITVILERYTGARWARAFDRKKLLRRLQFKNSEHLFSTINARPFPAVTSAKALSGYAAEYPHEMIRVSILAEQAIAQQVDLLGSGLVDLGDEIDWHKDYKTGHSWPVIFFRDIDYNNLDQPSDVKFPWELSRLQWLIPVGQAYLLTGEERYAEFVRDLISDWREANPYAQGVNWACTMEVALRTVTLTWLYKVFSISESWSKGDFRSDLLVLIYLHAHFTQHHLERSSVNGNHYTANAVGLVFAGQFFGQGRVARGWAKLGWGILKSEIKVQVHEDGVNFEASTAYHRLVSELFFYAARYRAITHPVSDEQYDATLLKMAGFAEAYCSPDGTSPLWGDADDARVLPFGGQLILDHRYLPELIRSQVENRPYRRSDGPSDSELLWCYGIALEATQRVSFADRQSIAFKTGGVYVMGSRNSQIFIDCGPLGLAGRGGHGHNDCLSFELWLQGSKLITDSGSYVYTASPEARNKFRSTSAHNTPLVDGLEVNRFPSDGSLWTLMDDASPELIRWQSSATKDEFEGSHVGYQRLTDALRVRRGIIFDKDRLYVRIEDHFKGASAHTIAERFHLAPGVEVVEQNKHFVIVNSKEETCYRMSVNVDPLAWDLSIESSHCSPSYGVVAENRVLVWSSTILSGAFSLSIEGIRPVS